MLVHGHVWIMVQPLHYIKANAARTAAQSLSTTMGTVPQLPLLPPGTELST
jgi:hypothetical protein